MDQVPFDMQLRSLQSTYEAAIKPRASAASIGVAFSALRDVAKAAKVQDMTLYSTHHEDFYLKYKGLVSKLPSPCPQWLEAARESVAVELGLEEAEATALRREPERTYARPERVDPQAPAPAAAKAQSATCTGLLIPVATAVAFVAVLALGALTQTS